MYQMFTQCTNKLVMCLEILITTLLIYSAFNLFRMNWQSRKNKVFNLTIYTGHPDRWCPLFLLQDSLMPGSKRCICAKDVETRTMTIWGRQWHVEPLPQMLKVMCGHRLIISGCVLVWCSESIESEKQILHYETPVKKMIKTKFPHSFSMP